MYFPLDKDIVREMWVAGDLKDQLGIRHRKGTKKATTTTGSHLESAPMFQQAHLRSVSEMSVNSYEPALLASPGSSGPPVRETYLDTPPISQSNNLDPGPSQYVYTRSHLDPVPVPMQNINRLSAPIGDLRNQASSPHPSYYSVSELPIPSPLPSPKYKLPSGEITSTPPLSRRGSIATTRASIRTARAPSPPIPPQPPLSPSSPGSNSLNASLHTPGRHGIIDPGAYEMSIRSPPRSPERQAGVEWNPNYGYSGPGHAPSSYVPRSPLERQNSSNYGHATERSASAMSYATANDDFFSAEEGPAQTHLAPSAYGYGYGGHEDRRTSGASWDGGRAL